MSFIIYKHTNNIDNKIYIGITNKINNPNKRWRTGKGYEHNFYFTAAIQMYGWDNFSHEIIDTAQTQAEANEKEKYWIKFYNSNNRDKGYNLTEGGDGNSGFRHTEESKNKIGISNGKKVICLETGQVFASSMEANRFIQCARGGVSRAIHAKGSAKSLHWAHVDEQEWTEEARQKRILEIINGQYKTQRKKVKCIETNQIYNSASEAGRQLKINEKNICSCCNKIGGRERAGGYHWEWVQ